MTLTTTATTTITTHHSHVGAGKISTCKVQLLSYENAQRAHLPRSSRRIVKPSITPSLLSHHSPRRPVSACRLALLGCRSLYRAMLTRCISRPNLRTQKRLAASVAGCGKRKIWVSRMFIDAVVIAGGRETHDANFHSWTLTNRLRFRARSVVTG